MYGYQYDLSKQQDTEGTCYELRILQKSILGYKLYVNDASVPIVLHTELDYEPYLAYHPFYIIEDATFDNIRYAKAIRVISPKIT